ncbi:MAG: sodium:calcium symporter [Methanoculleus sp. SDB]|nr:MAG: sodium:calcium symporter [Methanoculleus sp. SDB]
MERWSSGAGFVLAVIGSAVGIGNIWRFPAVLGENGGGAYLIPYLIAVFLCALPLMIFELALGRHFQGTIVSAFRSVRHQFRVFGWIICGIVFLILSYYLVIAGWTLGYFFFSLSGERIPFADFSAGWLPVLLFAATALAAGMVVSGGVRKGIERISTLLIPVSIGTLIILALYCTTLPGFSQGMDFLFTPDVTVLGNPLLWGAAFGQAFFSLSVGMGILLTYGAYVDQKQGIPVASLVITLADLGVALLSGMVIFPIVFSFGLAPAAGAELAFTTLPKAFAVMPGGRVIAAAFFLVLFFAALTSAISMLEMSVAALRESFLWSRKRAAAVLTGAVLVTGLPPALSYSAAGLTFDGIPVLDFLDETVGTLGLPVAAILLSIIFTWFLSSSRDLLAREIGNGLARIIYPLCTYIIPAVLIVTTGARLASGVDYPGLRNLPGSEFIGPLLQIEGIIVIILILLAASMVACRFGRCPLAGRLRAWRGRGNS